MFWVITLFPDIILTKDATKSSENGEMNLKLQLD